MQHLLRTFVGIRVGPGVRPALARAAQAVRGDDPALRLIAPADLHLTLHYLGATPAEDVSDIGSALDEAAAACAPFEVDYRGLGAFPDVARPRAIWAGVVDASGALVELQRAIGRALREVGYRPERRAFHPHVTLARVHRGPGAAVLEALRAGSDLDLGGEILSEVKLILSDPGQHPYHYIDLTTVELG
ncbi:MAG: RNA 2',3'-cyclic phosphodiesterase [Planctomycetota bacterium]|nr:RNA 2',3'-cyclic phosphodiesterase [Planctomycetota bacterium]